MNSILEGGEHLERELTPEPIAGPAAGAVVLHVALAACLAYYGWVLGLFHHNLWGGAGAGGAMQVSLVSSALPLPANELNNNVLATEKPSEAPAAPSPKKQEHVDQTAIPILGKQVKPKQQNTPKTQMHQPQPNMAQYGEQAGSLMPHQMQVGSTGPATVGDNGFANMYPWYVEPDQPEDGQRLEPVRSGSAHTKGGAGLPDLYHSPRRHRQRLATGPVQRQPHAGHFMRARRRTRGHIRRSAGGL